MEELVLGSIKRFCHGGGETLMPWTDEAGISWRRLSALIGLPHGELYQVQQQKCQWVSFNCYCLLRDLCVLIWVLKAYNSIFNSEPDVRLIGNFSLLPLRTRTRGPAYTLPPLDGSIPPSQSPEPDSESYDALDEVLSLFRANTFFRNFEIQGPADRLLIYGILFVSECLGKVKPSMSVRSVIFW
jgi:hypothetical protein